MHLYIKTNDYNCPHQRQNSHFPAIWYKLSSANYIIIKALFLNIFTFMLLAVLIYIFDCFEKQHANLFILTENIKYCIKSVGHRGSKYIPNYPPRRLFLSLKHK